MIIADAKLYWDNAATTPIAPEVLDAMVEAYGHSNASAFYSEEERKQIEETSEAVRRYVGAGDDYKVIYTGSGSAANALAVDGFLRKKRRITVLSDGLEHESIYDIVRHNLVRSFYIGTDREGLVDDDQVDALTKAFLEYGGAESVLVSLSLANNELGTVQDIGFGCKKAEQAYLHCDCVQAIGKMTERINMKERGIDCLTFSAHKINGPLGLGVMVATPEYVSMLNPIVYGEQQDGIHGGTYNYPAIIGLKKAIERLESKEHEANINRLINETKPEIVMRLRDRGYKVLGKTEGGIPVIAFVAPCSSKALMLALQTAGIYVSAGSACNGMSEKPSRVYLGIGLKPEEALSTIRISLPEKVEARDIDYFFQELDKSVRLVEATQ